MPTYQYACTSCGEQLEVVQKFTDDPLTVCPACGNGLRKVFSPVGIVFKGSGFYRTDSRKAPAGAGAGGSGDAGAKPNGSSGSSNGAKSDSKSPGGQSAASGGQKPGAKVSSATAS